MDNKTLHLAPHPTARNAAVAKPFLPSGCVVVSIPSLATCLLPSEKARRCDECHSLQSDTVKLRRCSRCASFWYCGTTCQNRAWKSHHKKICESYNTFIVSPQYQVLTAHDRVDAILLSQLVDPDVWRVGRRSDQDPFHESPISTFLDLLEMRRPDGFVPPLCLPKTAQSPETVSLARDLYLRFGNNNFVLHSHLNPYAHGVFPLASRLFNHSCVPNAACKYVISPSEPVRMYVVALHDIEEGEEVTIPYLDPALPYQTRQDALRANYGFGCECRFCAFQARVEPVPAPPARGTAEMRGLEAALRTFALGDVVQEDGIRIPTGPGLFERLPMELLPVLHETYLPSLSELFSRTSHEGPYADAVETGLTLLALYMVLYPPNYPQIGMHALELAKTLWNLVCTEPDGRLAGASEHQVKKHAKTALDFAAFILHNFGAEGDEGGPLEEIRMLVGMLNG